MPIVLPQVLDCCPVLVRKGVGTVAVVTHRGAVAVKVVVSLVQVSAMARCGLAAAGCGQQI